MHHVNPTGYDGPGPSPIDLLSALSINTVAAVIIAAVAVPLWLRRHLWTRTASLLLTATVLIAAVTVARTLITPDNEMDALSYITPLAVLGAAGLCRVFWTDRPAAEHLPAGSLALPTIVSPHHEQKDVPMKQVPPATASPVAERWVL